MKPRKFLFFLLYRFLVLPIFLGLIAPFALIFSAKFRHGLTLRMNSNKNDSDSFESTLWIHCASGEFEYAKPVIREIKEAQPMCKILVTYFSPSYKKQIETSPLVDASQILPLDLAGPIQTFIKKYKPQALLIARSDLWPELLSQCEKHNIPTLLFSHTKSKIHFITRPFERAIYNLLSDIYVVSESDRELMVKITNRPVSVGGDTRYDQVLYRLQNRTPHPKSRLFENKSFFIAGSTWPEDESALIPAIAAAKSNLGEKCFSSVIVPHEINETHLTALEQLLKEHNLESARLSQTEIWHKNVVMIVDQIGLLADLYAHCKFAFVGGSFKKKVHSVMEPLGAKKAVIVGPYYRNNREAIEFSHVTVHRDHTAVTVAHNSDELKELLIKTNELQNLHHEKTAAIILTEFAIKTGATKAVLMWLRQKGVLT